MEQIEVTIDADGVVTVEAKNVRGQGCAALTRSIEQALGTTTRDQKKPEFYQQEQARARNAAGQGH